MCCYITIVLPRQGRVRYQCSYIRNRRAATSGQDPPDSTTRRRSRTTARISTVSARHRVAHIAVVRTRCRGRGNAAAVPGNVAKNVPSSHCFSGGACRRHARDAPETSSAAPFFVPMETSKTQDGACLESVSELVPRLFRGLGGLVARRPATVITIAVWIMAGLLGGLYFIDVNSDPNKIWVPPSSTTSLQQNQFNDVFNPFFRIEQVMFTLKPEAMYVATGAGVGVRAAWAPARGNDGCPTRLHRIGSA